MVNVILRPSHDLSWWDSLIASGAPCSKAAVHTQGLFQILIIDIFYYLICIPIDSRSIVPFQRDSPSSINPNRDVGSAPFVPFMIFFPMTVSMFNRVSRTKSNSEVRESNLCPAKLQLI